MRALSRSVRFSINPFLPEDLEGANSYASLPAGDGLSMFFELTVTLAGRVDAATGFVVNVSEIDDKVRRFVVPVFAESLRRAFVERRHMGLAAVTELLRDAQRLLADKFEGARTAELAVRLSPFKELGIRSTDNEEAQMVYYSEKFEFAATHKLWNDDFDEQRNFEIFGKCAGKAGHGHNYIVEVTVEMAGRQNFKAGDFETLVNAELMELVDHKNLNTELVEFAKTIPTVENLAVFAWGRLVGKFAGARLHCVTIWETDRTSCSYYGTDD